MLYNHTEALMSRIRPALTLCLTLIGGTAMADAPRVAVDIAPVPSLVARVMADVGTPDLILPPGASPHEYNLRPSEASALQNADIVVWMGEDLAPWMDHAVETLAANASVLTLLEADVTTRLDVRENALFEAHSHDDHDDHGHKEDGHDDHGHDDHAHDDHGHDDHADHAAHDDHDDHADHDTHDHAEHDDHAHGSHDPHAWLSPANAGAWLNLIAAELSAADPENAGTYFANAAAARAELDELNAEINATLDPVRNRNFIVFHDAYQYFEAAFDFPAAGAISLSDATDPSPARIAQVRDRVRDQDIACVLTEPQFNPGILATVLDGTTAKTAVSDPLGVDLTPGPALYPQLIRNLAIALASCL